MEAEVVFLEASSGPGIELIHYRMPAGSRPDDLGRPNVQGLRHVAFRVTDLDRLVAAIEAAGIKVLARSSAFRLCRSIMRTRGRAWCIAMIPKVTYWNCAITIEAEQETQVQVPC